MVNMYRWRWSNVIDVIITEFYLDLIPLRLSGIQPGGYELTAICHPGWGTVYVFDWNGLPVGKEFDGKFLKNVKSSPHACLASFQLRLHRQSQGVGNVTVSCEKSSCRYKP